MRKSQPDGTERLPETAEVGGEGGSFGESASRESRDRQGHVPRVDENLTDRAGNVTRLPEVGPEDHPEDRVKPSTEP